MCAQGLHVSLWATSDRAIASQERSGPPFTPGRKAQGRRLILSKGSEMWEMGIQGRGGRWVGFSLRV